MPTAQQSAGFYCHLCAAKRADPLPDTRHKSHYVNVCGSPPAASLRPDGVFGTDTGWIQREVFLCGSGRTTFRLTFVSGGSFPGPLKDNTVLKMMCHKWINELKRTVRDWPEEELTKWCLPSAHSDWPLLSLVLTFGISKGLTVAFATSLLCSKWFKTVKTGWKR